MHNNLIRTGNTTFLFIVILTLGGCGIDKTTPSSGTGSSSSSSAVGPDYSSNATAAKLTGTIEVGSDTRVTLKWIDSFPTGTTYSIYSISDATAVPYLITQISNFGSGSAFGYTTLPITSATIPTYRVEASRDGISLRLKTPSGADFLAPTLPTIKPDISTDKTEPLTGSTALSLTPGLAYSKVIWSMDGITLGTSTGGSSLIWNTDAESAGNHVIDAVGQQTADTFVHTSKTMRNTNAGASLYFFNITSTAIQIGAVPFSPSIVLEIDGTAVGTLNTPNTCVMCASPVKNIYQFDLSPSLEKGHHVIIAKSTNSAGVTVRAVKTVDLN